MDFDADGNLDLLLGSFNGFIYLAKGRGGIDFQQAEQLKLADGSPAHAGYTYDYEAKGWPDREGVHGLHPRLVDWDADGDLDLFMVGRRGQVVLRLRDDAGFSEALTRVMVEGKPAMHVDKQIGYTVEVADWDGDGLIDLVSYDQKSHTLSWHKNIGKAGAPNFGPAQPLMTYQPGKNGPQSSNRFDVADFNADGKLDIIIGGGYYISGSKEDSGAWVYLQE